MTTLLLACLGCGSPVFSPVGAPATVPTYENGGVCVAEPGVTGLEPPATGAWLQYLIVQRDEPVVGYRIYGDGRYEVYRKGAWAAGRPLTAAELEVVRGTVDRADIASWRSYTANPPVQSMHGPEPAITVDLWTAGGSWHRRIDDDCAFEPLFVLADTMNRTIDPMKGRPSDGLEP